MLDVRRQFGNQGEACAANFLESKGYTILASQWRCPFGEIDLIAEQGSEIVFVEVKTRRDQSYGFPEESVTEKKIGHLVACAQAYLDRIGKEVPWRIDVIAVEFDHDKPVFFHVEAIDIPERFW